MAGIADFYPNRWDYRPGQSKPATVGVTFRLGEWMDVPQIRRFLRARGNATASERAIKGWIGDSGWTLWLAVRNLYNIVGLVATRHEPGLNRVLRYGALDPATLLKLLLFASYEMPENPTELVVSDTDVQTQTTLREAGLVAVKADCAAEHHVFRHPAAVVIRPRAPTPVGPKDRVQDQGPPARD